MSQEEDENTQMVTFTEEQLNEFGKDIIEWAETKKLDAYDLCVVLGLMYEKLKDELGVKIELSEESAPIKKSDKDDVH